VAKSANKDEKLSTSPVRARRVFPTRRPTERIYGRVVAEQAVTIRVKGVGEFTLLCTPLDLEALAAGFAHSEGMIESANDILRISRDERQPDLVELEVANPDGIAGRRNMLVSSSCGLCGVRLIERTLWNTPPVPKSLRLSAELLIRMPDRLVDEQRIYRQTRGAHAAGIFDDRGDFLAFAEDIGRHNALDKVIGKCLLGRRPPRGLGVVLTSRASFEMVAKAGRAGLELIAAVSAPSSLAVETARTLNITLCGSVQRGKADLFTHPRRVVVAGRPSSR
jgi:FdhD protein